LCYLRCGQAEAYAYGLPQSVQTEAEREFRQTLEYPRRKAYSHSVESVGELAVTTFFENHHDSTDFRLAVKRTRQKSLHAAITAALQEKNIRMTDSEITRMDLTFTELGKGNGRRNFTRHRNSESASYNARTTGDNGTSRDTG